MPTYEYKCRKCGNEFEIQQRITEDALTECPQPECHGEIYRKISKNVGLVFNGKGFYITDYTKKNGSVASNSNGDSHSSNGDSHNGKSDIKESKSENPGNGNAKETKEVAKTETTSKATATAV